MKVAKLKQLIKKLDDKDDIFFTVDLPKKASWADNRVQMALGRLRFADTFKKDDGTSEHFYQFACKLEVF